MSLFRKLRRLFRPPRRPVVIFEDEIGALLAAGDYLPPTVSCLDHDPTPRRDCIACLEASAYCPHGHLLKHPGCPPQDAPLTDADPLDGDTQVQISPGRVDVAPEVRAALGNELLDRLNEGGRR